MNGAHYPYHSSSKPLRLFVSLLLVIFLLEAFIMVFLPIILPEANTFLRNFTDSLMLATLSAPFIWWLIARPLKNLAMNEITRTKAVIEYIDDAVICFNSELNIESLNPAAEKMFGYSPYELVGQTVSLIIPEMENHKADATNYMRLKCTGSEITGCHKNKSCFPVEIYISKLQLEGKWISIAILQDKTERVRIETAQRQLENELIQERALYKDLVDSQPVGVYRLRVIPMTACDAAGWRGAVDSHYSFDMMSLRFSEILGIDHLTLKKNPGMVPDLVHPEDRAGFIDDNVQAVNNLTPFKWSGRLGNEQFFKWVRFESVPRKLDTGDILWTGVVTNITDSKQAEESLRDMQTQIMQNDKLATIGQLAAGVAHEINNPMGFVGSNMVTLAKYIEKYNRYIDLIEQEIRSVSFGVLPQHIQSLRQTLKLDYVIRDISVLVEECNEGIDRVKRIVQDLRTFSRADSSTIGSTDLNSCMESTINIVINEIKYAAELKREYGDLPRIPCNAQQINQVFMNLLINAAHAIQAKGEEVGEITIRTWCDHDNAFVSVSDSGCGIAPENCGKIFDAFFTTKEIGKGTGLGLSISSGIIRKHGGEIMLSSEVGVGSTFAVRLPLKPAQRTDEESQ